MTTNTTAQSLIPTSATATSSALEHPRSSTPSPLELNTIVSECDTSSKTLLDDHSPHVVENHSSPRAFYRSRYGVFEVDLTDPLQPKALLTHQRIPTRPNPHPIFRRRTPSSPGDVDMEQLVKERLRKKIDAPGPFTPLEMLHQGDKVSAHAVYDQCTSSVICLKVVDKTNKDKEDRTRALRYELKAYQRISRYERSPYVMQLEGVFQDQEAAYFAMELMPLDLHAATEVLLTPAVTRRWLAQAAAGIHALHCMGIIHRDVKPENFLIDQMGNTRISDFGCALVLDSRLEDCIPSSRELCGTHGYMAPEMLTAASLQEWAGEAVDEEEYKLFNPWGGYGNEVDWWGLGCTFFEMLTTQRLFCRKKDMKDYITYCKMGDLQYLTERAQVHVVNALEDGADRVLVGLLDINPATRFTWDGIQQELFFISAGVNEFDVLERCSPDVKRFRASKNLCAQLPITNDVPSQDLFSITEAEIARTRKSDRSQYLHLGDRDQQQLDKVWKDFGWINPYGMWRSYRQFNA